MNEVEKIKVQAMETRELYLAGAIDYKEAQKRLKPYRDWYNQRSAEIAAKYGQKPKRFNFGEFMKGRFL